MNRRVTCVGVETLLTCGNTVPEVGLELSSITRKH